MATQAELANALIVAKQRLMHIVAAAVATAWHGLPHYDQAQVDQFLSVALPIAAAGNQQTVALTEAFLAQALGARPLGLDAEQIIAGIRNGATPEQVYTRSFVTVWSALKNGTPWAQAVKMGLDRSTSAAATDVQLSFTHTLVAAGQASDRIVGYERVPDAGACDYCKAATGQIYHTSQLLPMHSWCVTGETLVSIPPPARSESSSADLVDIAAVTRRWYEGEVVCIRTAAGHELAVTPNHPVLTHRGWLAAGLLSEGDCVIGSARRDREVSGVPGKQDMPTRIEDLFRALSVRGLVAVPFAAEHFHGDAGDGHVDVVSADSDLDPRFIAALLQPPEHSPLATGLSSPGRLVSQRRPSQGLLGSRLAAHSCMGCGRSLAPLLGRLPSGREPALLRHRAHLHTRLHQMPRDHVATHSMPLRYRQDRLAGGVRSDGIGEIDPPRAGEPLLAQFARERSGADADGGRGLLDRLAGEIQLDRITHLERIDRSCHVFNLVTREGWYIANGVFTHNCGCGVQPVSEGDTHPFVTAPARFPGANGLEVAVHQHGELGPVLTNAADHFTGPAAVGHH